MWDSSIGEFRLAVYYIIRSVCQVPRSEVRDKVHGAWRLDFSLETPCGVDFTSVPPHSWRVWSIQPPTPYWLTTQRSPHSLHIPTSTRAKLDHEYLSTPIIIHSLAQCLSDHWHDCLVLFGSISVVITTLISSAVFFKLKIHKICRVFVRLRLIHRDLSLNI